MRIREILAILVCPVLLVTAVVASRDRNEPAPALPLKPFEAPVVLTEGPVTYFVTNCARCHGPMEDAYKEFPQPRHGEELQRMLLIMANGPAMAPLDEASLQEQTDLHLAILERRPYVWIDPTVSDVIALETMPEATVTLITPTQRVQAASEDQRYVLPRERGTIEVRWLDKTVQRSP